MANQRQTEHREDRGNILHEVLNEACAALEAGYLLPLLGAGVSMASSVGFEEDMPAEDLQPHNNMPKQLAQFLSDKLYKQTPLAALLRSFLPGRCSPIEELRSLGLAKLAELYLLFDNETELCSLLKISQFTRLQPTPAHRYIAYLVREGALNEVITTNYDTCLERAWLESKGQPAGDEFTHPIRKMQPDDGSGWQVVTDHLEYSGINGNGAPSGVGGMQRARLFKINGCALRLSDAKETAQAKKLAEAQRIILTERQLQSFRKETWAREMFRDRLRHKKLLFSGFGSEEPQIRHTVLALLDELSDLHSQCPDKSNETANPDGGWQTRTAPIVHQYGPHLTFNQNQILLAWWRIWRSRESERYPGSGLRNGITGRDAQWFRTDSDSEQLSPGGFWRALFQNWWWRRLRREWSRGELAETISKATDIRADVVTQWATEAMDCWFDTNNGTQCRHTDHLAFSASAPDGTHELSLMRQLHPAFDDDEHYHPLESAPRSIALYTLLLAAQSCAATEDQWIQLIPTGGARQCAHPKLLEMHAAVAWIRLPVSRRPGNAVQPQSSSCNVRSSSKQVRIERLRKSEHTNITVHEGLQLNADELLAEALRRRPMSWTDWANKIRNVLKERSVVTQNSINWRNRFAAEEVGAK